MAEAKTTTDHATIRKWAEQRGGVSGNPGILRLDFEPQDGKLDQITWNEFFAKFEKEKLALLYQETTEDGSESRFHKFVKVKQALRAASRKIVGLNPAIYNVFERIGSIVKSASDHL